MRFSVLTPTYYSERFDTLEKVAAHLFSDARMELRFRIFENLVLPSLLAQSDPDFHMVVLCAEQMPQPLMTRLADVLDPVPNIHLRPVGTDKHYQIIKDAYASVPVEDATHRIMFRLDDDDAVDTNYVKRLKGLARGLNRLHRKDVPHVISFNRGFYVRCKPGENEVFDACERAPLSTGTALLAPLDYPRNPYRYNHRSLAQHYNTYSDITTPAFIRTIHGDNKSQPSQMGRTHKMPPAALRRSLRKHFGIPIDVLRAL